MKKANKKGSKDKRQRRRTITPRKNKLKSSNMYENVSVDNKTAMTLVAQHLKNIFPATESYYVKSHVYLRRL